MSIQTIKATIQMRHGLEAELDSDQLVAGEWAVSTDKKYVRMCFAPGIVLRMATYEAFEQDMTEIQTILATCQEIQTAVDTMAELAEQHKNDAENYAKLSESWAHGDTGERVGENSDNSKYWSKQAKSEADRAKSEADRASSIAGIDIDSELSDTSTNPVQNKVITKALSEVSVDISNDSVEFTEAETRSNIQSGEKIPVLFGKIKKWFTDFAEVTFSGSYEDLLNKPEIPTVPDALKNPNALIFTGSDTGSYDGSEEKTVHIPSGVNNLLATVSGFWLDATQGKVLDDKISELISNISSKDIITIAPTNCSNFPGYGNSYYYKKGSRVHIHLGLSDVPGTGATIYTMPTGYRPYSITVAMGFGDSSGNIPPNVKIQETGSIVVNPSINNSHVMADVEYDAYS